MQEHFLPADWHSAQGCLENLHELNDSLNESPTSYFMKCEGLLGLNHLLFFNPQEVWFSSPSKTQLEYTELILELIRISNSAEEWISRVFSRSVAAFIERGDTLFPFSRLEIQSARFSLPKEQLKLRLNEFTQWAYLHQPLEEALLLETLALLSPQGKERYERFLMPYIKTGICLERERCQRLLPCWSIREPVPFSLSEPMGKNIDREYEPNTNTFYYGNLWLTNEKTFLTIKKKISQAKLHFVERE